MQFHRQLATFVVFLFFRTTLACSSGAQPCIGPLDPWTVSRLQITAPTPGRDGPLSIDLAIENPNRVTAGPAPHAAGGGYLSFEPSAVNCTVADEDGKVNNTCTESEEASPSYGMWSIDVAPGAAEKVDPRNLDLAFNLNYNVTRWGSILYKVYDGTAHFEVGTNMAEGGCDDASGTCVFNLKSESVPVLVSPTMTACQGTC
ncbi:hypothetical protein GGS26DRAFT_256618 [Hypomontagnella submonticulosa]|nr:hypothetical protein GGS26DRAFT_256618 [Hypomontagnella submonticulosa]